MAEGLAARAAELAEIGKRAKESDGKPLRTRARVGSGYPRLSHAMGVHRTQREEAKALDAKLGVPTEYSPDGRPEFRTRAHQKAWVKAHGLINADGAYGD
jgi:hypothetical protein